MYIKKSNLRATLRYHVNTVILLETKMLSVKCKKEDASSFKKNVKFFFPENYAQDCQLASGPNIIPGARL